MDDYHVSFDAGRVAAVESDRATAGRADGAVGPGGGGFDQRPQERAGGVHVRQGPADRGDRQVLPAVGDRRSRRSPRRHRREWAARRLRLHPGDQGPLGDGHAQQRGEDARHDSPPAQGRPARQPGAAGLGRGDRHQPERRPAPSQALRDFIVTAQRSNIAVYPMDPCGLDLRRRVQHQLAPEPADRWPRPPADSPSPTPTRPSAASTGWSPRTAPTTCSATRRRRRQRRQAPPDRGAHRESRRRGACPRQLHRAPRALPRTIEAPSSVDSLISAPIQIARADHARRGRAGAAGRRSPVRRSPSGSRCPRPTPLRAGSIDFSLRRHRHRRQDPDAAALQEQVHGEGTSRRGGGSASGRASTSRRDGIRYGWPPSAASGEIGSVFTEVIVPDFTDALALGGPLARVAGAPQRQLAELLADVLPLVPLASRGDSRPAPDRRAASDSRQQPGGGPLPSIDARLTRNERRRSQSMPASAAPAGRAVHGGPAGAVYRCALPANLEPGDYRLVVDVASGKMRRAGRCRSGSCRDAVSSARREGSANRTLPDRRSCPSGCAHHPSTDRATAAPAPAGRRDTRCDR